MGNCTVNKEMKSKNKIHKEKVYNVYHMNANVDQGSMFI